MYLWLTLSLVSCLYMNYIVQCTCTCTCTKDWQYFDYHDNNPHCNQVVYPNTAISLSKRDAFLYINSVTRYYCHI